MSGGGFVIGLALDRRIDGGIRSRSILLTGRANKVTTSHTSKLVAPMTALTAFDYVHLCNRYTLQ